MIVASGNDRSGLNARGQVVGSFADFAAFEKARNDLSISEQEALAIVEDVAKRKQDGPVSSLKYFKDALARYAGDRDAPAFSAASPMQVNGPPRSLRPDLRKMLSTMPELKS